MPRRKKQQPEPESMSAPVRRRLTEDDLVEKRVEFSRQYAVLRGLEREKADATRRMNRDIKKQRELLDKQHEEIMSGEEEVSQGDLFSQEEAARALAQVETHASSGEEAAP